MLDHLPQIVSFVGAIGAGKSTAAQYLVEKYGYTKVSFAQPIKDMLKVLGLSDSQLCGDMKEVPCDELNGRTPRWAMQSLGTEWGRVCMGKDFWVNRGRQKIKHILAQGGRVVLDDCRFENEDIKIRELGGIHVRIAREESEFEIPTKPFFARFLPSLRQRKHISEAYWVDSDFDVLNDESVEEFHGEIEAILSYYSELNS